MTSFSPVEDVGARGSSISVALCTCNGARFVEAQVRSICIQSRPPDELVVFDDASLDGTLDLVRAVLRDHAPASLRIELHRNPRRLGVAANFQAAMLRCQGTLIALADQDDVWPADRLDRMEAVLDTDADALLVHGNAELVGADGLPLGALLFDTLGVRPSELCRVETGRAFDVLLDRNVVTGAATMMRARLVTLACPIPPHWLHDEWLGAIAAAMGGLRVMRSPVLYYRQHGSNQIGAAARSWRNELRRLREPITLRNRQLHARARELAERLAQLDAAVPAAAIASALDKVGHHAMRANLPTWRVGRLPFIAFELARGRYHRYGRGWKGAALDLIAR